MQSRIIRAPGPHPTGLLGARAQELGVRTLLPWHQQQRWTIQQQAVESHVPGPHGIAMDQWRFSSLGKIMELFREGFPACSMWLTPKGYVPGFGKSPAIIPPCITSGTPNWWTNQSLDQNSVVPNGMVTIPHLARPFLLVKYLLPLVESQRKNWSRKTDQFFDEVHGFQKPYPPLGFSNPLEQNVFILGIR